MALYVADTHAVIWYATGQRKRLGSAARSAFQAADAKKAAIYIPAMVLVELLEVVRRGDVKLDRGPIEWARDLFRTGGFIFVDLTFEIIETANRLGTIRARGDRLIAATALSLELPLITRDPVIAATDVTTLW